MLINKNYCDENTCVALRELGYNYPQRLIPDYFGVFEEPHYDEKIHLYDAQQWLRERHNLHITIYSQSQESWQYRITKPHQRLEDGLHGEDFSSYEDALNHAIKECIKHVD